MNLKALSSEGKIAYLIKPILKVLQEAGGQLERSEIKERIADMDDQIAEYSDLVKKSKKTGNTYKEFNFKFNFAIKDLFFNGLLTYTNSSPITLTEKGLYLDVDKLDVQKDIIETSKKHWDELSQNNKKNKVVDISDNEEEPQAEERIKDDFKETLLAAIAKMTPKKFEAFSRALLNRMGVEFTEKGDGRLRPYLNKVLLAESAGICSTEFHVMRVIDTTTVLPEYVAAILRSDLILSQTRHMMTGNTHPRISNDDVKNLCIPVPNIDVQAEIVKELGKRRIEARMMRAEAEQEWQAAKKQFEKELLRECDIFIADLSGARHNVMIEVGYALKHVKTARMLFYFQASDKCPSVPFDVSHLNYVPIVDSAEIKTSVKARIENILKQARNGEI